MTDKMLKFVKIGQQTPPKREIDVRKKDFNEIYDEFISDKAKNNLADVLSVVFLFVKFIVP